MGAKRDHWVVIPDDILRLVEDGVEDEATEDELFFWVDEVRHAILDGLETA
jgi:hypothetical protein